MRATDRPAIASLGLVSLAAVVVSVVRTFPLLDYPQHWLNPYDESFYIEGGRSLASGRLPSFSASPLTSVFYTPLSWAFDHDDWWLFEAASYGHRIFFLALWAVTVVLAWSTRDKVRGWTVLVWPVAVPAFFGLVSNSSDALFAILNGASLAGFLAYVRNREPRTLFVTATLVGLSPLARSDGLLLVGIFLGASFVVLVFERATPRVAVRRLALMSSIAAAPTLAFFAVQGSFETGLGERSYVAFSQGQGYVYAERYPYNVNPAFGGAAEADRLYGTATENGNSVWRAILNNPGAFKDRLVHSLRKIPGQASSALGWPLIVMSCVGMVRLWRMGDRPVAFLACAWTLFLGAYFVTFFRPGYFLMAVFPLILLAGAGLDGAVEAGHCAAQRVSSRLLGDSRRGSEGTWRVLAAAVGVCVILVLSEHLGIPDEYKDPDGYEVDRDALVAEAALLESLPQGSRVAAMTPQAVYNARLTHVDFHFEPSPRDVTRWITTNTPDFILLEPRTGREAPELHDAIVSMNADLQVLYDHDGLSLFGVAGSEAARRAR